MLSTTIDPDYVAYLKMPVMLLVRPVDRHQLLTIAYHRGLLEAQWREQEEVEKICDWFVREFIPLRTEIIYHIVRLQNVKPYKIPTLDDLRFRDYIRCNQRYDIEDYRVKLTARGNKVSQMYCGCIGYI